MVVTRSLVRPSLERMTFSVFLESQSVWNLVLPKCVGWDEVYLVNILMAKSATAIHLNCMNLKEKLTFQLGFQLRLFAIRLAG